MATDTWDSIDDFIAVLQLMRDGKWDWYANTRCKYVELRVDMRDGGCIIKDRESKRISSAQLAYQYSSKVAIDADEPSDAMMEKIKSVVPQNLIADESL